jgi:hypothetical protein
MTTTIDFDIASDITIADFLATLTRHSGRILTFDALDFNSCASITASFPSDTAATCYLLDIGIDPDDIDIYLPSV